MITIKEYLVKVDEVIAKGRFKDDWVSLSQWKMPEWYRNGRFGLFIHWGVYSVPATESEWYPRLMYIKGTKSYEHRIATYGNDCDYRQLVEKFVPDKFDADEWLQVFKASGAKYIMPVCEHHDGIKMYKSDLNVWNTVDLPQHRDYIAELHAASDKAELGFFCSNHRAEHYWFLNGARKYCPESEVAKNLYPELYGPAKLNDNGNVHAYDGKPLCGADAEGQYPVAKEWLEDWLASSCEMIDKNRPLAVYFDWWINKPEFKPYVKKFLAYYYNRADEWGMQVGVFYKVGSVMKDCAIFDVERGQINGISAELWQNDTAIAKNSWGYTENNKFKTPYEIITNMVDVVSKNGCYMLNVGPKANGEICAEEKDVLLAIGKWMLVNGEAIYGSYPFDIYGEGKTRQNKSFYENMKYGNKEYRFTYKPGAIYIFPMSEKARAKHSIKSLRFANSEGIRYDIKHAEILGYPNSVKWTQSVKALDIVIEGELNMINPICIKLIVD